MLKRLAASVAQLPENNREMSHTNTYLLAENKLLLSTTCFDSLKSRFPFFQFSQYRFFCSGIVTTMAIPWSQNEALCRPWRASFLAGWGRKRHSLLVLKRWGLKVKIFFLEIGTCPGSSSTFVLRSSPGSSDAGSFAGVHLTESSSAHLFWRFMDSNLYKMDL